MAPPGHVFWARDFSAIEAVLVGYFAGSARYIRFAKLGVHAYLASHLAGCPADLRASDDDLRGLFRTLKKERPKEYNTAKRVVHLSNYMGTPRRMWIEYPETFRSVNEAAKLQGFYFELFPEIREWHRELCLRVDGTKRRKRGDNNVDPELLGVVRGAGGTGEETLDPWTLGVCYAQNPFGYVHRFYDVLHWTKVGSEWVWEFGEDAKRLISFLPQSTASAIIKRAAKRLWYEYPWIGHTLRLLIHDEILGECEEREVEDCLRISGDVMEAPIEELPLDPAWGMGEFLTIGTEAKVGRSWAGMH